MRVVGNTTDGRPVIAGLYSIYETHGIPLDVVISECVKRGAVPSWSHMVGEANAAGMGLRRAISKVSQAVRDAACHDADIICESLQALL